MQRTNMIKIVITMLMTLLAGNVLAASPEQAAAQPAWVTGNLHQLQKILPDKAAVDNLIKKLYGDSIVQPAVGQYAFADLDADGTIELVATIDFSGRGFFNTINIVRNVGGKFKTSTIQSNGINIPDLRSHLVDLNHDGAVELLVPHALAPYAGTTPIPVINDVYRWNGVQYEKANAAFKGYYRNTVRPRLDSALDALAHGRSSASERVNKLLKAKYQKELDAVDAILKE